MPIVNTPNMVLPVPIVGSEVGPQYAIDVNNCFSILDSHDHSPGKGVKLTPSGLNINSNLSFSNNNAIDLRSVRFTPQSSPIALASDLNCLSVAGVDLYYNDGNGNQIQITDNGGISGTPGSIANLVSPASASYVSADSTFVWQSDANTAANMDAASYILRNLTANSFGLTLNPPNAMGSDRDITFPNLPVSTSFLTIDSSGNMGASITISLGITDTMLAADSVITSKILDGSVTEPKLANDSVSTRTIIDENVTPAKMAPFVINNSGASTVVNSTSYVDITSITLAVSGVRPVLLMLNNFNNGGAAGFLSVTDASNPAVGIFTFNADGDGDLGIFEVSTNVIGSALTIPASASFIHQPSAGTRTYKIRAKVASGTTNFTFTNIQLVAYEL